jgi:two-component system, chemotaxis family, response regulator Rcp1
MGRVNFTRSHFCSASLWFTRIPQIYASQHLRVSLTCIRANRRDVFAMKEGSTVLLVDDNEADVTLLKHALTAVGLEFDVHVAHNGLEAINYLKKACENHSSEFPMPKFILTDNRMPVMTGRDLLRWLNEHPRCRVIPSVVLGGSDSPSDVEESYELGAHSYFVKPIDHRELQELVKMIFHYWASARVPAAVSSE